MIDLKMFLDKLAGEDHPFVKGAPIAHETVNTEAGLEEMVGLEKNDLPVKRFLRLNTN